MTRETARGLFHMILAQAMVIGAMYLLLSGGH